MGGAEGQDGRPRWLGANPGFEGYGPISMLTGQGALAFAMMKHWFKVIVSVTTRPTIFLCDLPSQRLRMVCGPAGVRTNGLTWGAPGPESPMP